MLTVQKFSALILALLLASLIGSPSISVAENEQFIYHISTLGSPTVKGVTIWTENQVENLPVLEFLTDKPDNVPDPPVPVSTYFSIEPAVQVSAVEIEFRVSQDWLDRNRVPENGVVLLRFDGGWTEFPTAVDNTDENYVHCRATPSGLSIFAIGGHPLMEQGWVLYAALMVAAVAVISLAYWFVVRPRRTFVSLKKLESETGKRIPRKKTGKKEPVEPPRPEAGRSKPRPQESIKQEDVEILKKLKKKTGKGGK